MIFIPKTRMCLQVSQILSWVWVRFGSDRVHSTPSPPRTPNLTPRPSAEPDPEPDRTPGPVRSEPGPNPNPDRTLASLPKIDIWTVLDPLTSLKISLHDEIGQKEDILEYIKSAVHSDRRMWKWKEEYKELVVDTLSFKADGM